MRLIFLQFKDYKIQQLIIRKTDLDSIAEICISTWGVLVKPQWTHSLYNSHTQQDSCSRYMYEDALNCNTVYIQQYLFSSLLYSKCFV